MEPPLLSDWKRFLEFLCADEDFTCDRNARVEIRHGDADLALCAATRLSAARTSGRRRRRSAGMPMATSAGAEGMRPSPSDEIKSTVGCPSNVQSRLFACRKPTSKGRILALVASKFDSDR